MHAEDPRPWFEAEVRAVALARLWRNQANPYNPPKVAFVAIDGGDNRSAADPDAALLAKLQRILPVLVRKASLLPNESDHDQELRDPATGAPAVLLTLGKVETQNRHFATVAMRYRRARRFQLRATYRLEIDGASWRVVQEEAKDTPSFQTIDGRSGRHTLTVTLARRAIHLRDHRIIRAPNPDGSYLLDGKPALGRDGGIPNVELVRFDVTVDGKRWNVPDRLWRDCFDMGMSEPIQVSLSPDGARLTLTKGGGDGAGGYIVHWRLRRDGKHTREIEAP